MTNYKHSLAAAHKVASGYDGMKIKRVEMDCLVPSIEFPQIHLAKDSQVGVRLFAPSCGYAQRKVFTLRDARDGNDWTDYIAVSLMPNRKVGDITIQSAHIQCKKILINALARKYGLPVNIESEDSPYGIHFSMQGKSISELRGKFDRSLDIILEASQAFDLAVQSPNFDRLAASYDNQLRGLNSLFFEAMDVLSDKTVTAIKSSKDAHERDLQYQHGGK